MIGADGALNGQLTRIPEDIPDEIIHEIFRLGSRGSTKLAYNLCLVSSWVRAIALPGLYAFVSLGTEEKTEKLYRTLAMGGLMTRPRTRAFRPTITAINFRDCPYKAVPIFLAYAETLQHIILSSQALILLRISFNQDSHPIREIQSMLCSRQIGLNIILTDNTYQAMLEAFSATSPRVKFFDCVNMLRLPEPDEPALAYNAETLHQLFPSLTHIALPITHKEIDLLIGLLAHPSLKFIVLLVSDDTLFEAIHKDSEDSWLQPTRDHNIRNIKIEAIHTQTDPKSLLHRWEAEMRGGESVWMMEQ